MPHALLPAPASGTAILPTVDPSSSAHNGDGDDAAADATTNDVIHALEHHSIGLTAHNDDLTRQLAALQTQHDNDVRDACAAIADARRLAHDAQHALAAAHFVPVHTASTSALAISPASYALPSSPSLLPSPSPSRWPPPYTDLRPLAAIPFTKESTFQEWTDLLQRCLSMHNLVHILTTPIPHMPTATARSIARIGSGASVASGASSSSLHTFAAFSTRPPNVDVALYNQSTRVCDLFARSFDNPPDRMLLRGCPPNNAFMQWHALSEKYAMVSAATRHAANVAIVNLQQLARESVIDFAARVCETILRGVSLNLAIDDDAEKRAFALGLDHSRFAPIRNQFLLDETASTFDIFRRQAISIESDSATRTAKTSAHQGHAAVTAVAPAAAPTSPPPAATTIIRNRDRWTPADSPCQRCHATDHHDGEGDCPNKAVVCPKCGTRGHSPCRCLRDERIRKQMKKQLDAAAVLAAATHIPTPIVAGLGASFIGREGIKYHSYGC